MFNKDERFVQIYKQQIYMQEAVSVMAIWVDKVTGVNYLYHENGYSDGGCSGGLTPLLDKDGKPVISNLSE
ncbi:MAG: xylan 1,4-beta-xylosidase [Ruminococcus sp.]|nr:xylan 1,4-beta-xylosidase [Ruminococcus sp.]MDE6789354.1 xylan 1,4-beta-xylosidase [Ruminococcus sp.]